MKIISQIPFIYMLILPAPQWKECLLRHASYRRYPYSHPFTTPQYRCWKSGFGPEPTTKCYKFTYIHYIYLMFHSSLPLHSRCSLQTCCMGPLFRIFWLQDVIQKPTVLAQESWHSKHFQPTHPPTSDFEWENDSPPRLTNRWGGMRMTPPYIQTAEGEKIEFFEEVLKGVHFCCPPAAAMTCHWNALLAIHVSCWMLRWLGCCTLR